MVYIILLIFIFTIRHSVDLWDEFLGPHPQKYSLLTGFSIAGSSQTEGVPGTQHLVNKWSLSK